MSEDTAPLSKRYALKIALVYLLIRGAPELLFLIFSQLPEETALSIGATYGDWIRYFLPVVPLQIFSVPLGFQYTLALLPVLIIEVLLVFLFSAWFMLRRPGAFTPAHGPRRWIILVLAVLLWSYLARMLVLGYIEDRWIDQLQLLRASDNWFTLMPPLLLKANRTLTTILYATTPLWAWVPVWLHFRFARKSIDSAAHAPGEHTPAADECAAPLQRAVVFAAFLLGCLGLHFVLVLLTYIGLWPWAVEQADIKLPFETLNELSLPLTISQIVLASLVAMLAATIYLRRLPVSYASRFALVFRPLLSGMLVTLLTGFLLLALMWGFMWFSPGAVESSMRQFSRDPQSSLPVVIALNILTVVVLCLVSGSVRQAPRRWTAALAFLMLCLSMPLYVVWNIATSNMGIAGGTPGMAVTGTLGDARWRNMEQWCTGVVQTRHGTWLVGRDEVSSRGTSYVPEGVPDLSELVIDEDGPPVERRFGMFGSRPTLTTLSLLQDDGTFKMVATVPEVACLVVSPEAETLFLLTGVDRPPVPRAENKQSVVFRSTDHGATWQWLKAGFMTEAAWLAWSVKPTFATDRDVWAWGKEPPPADEPVRTWQRPAPAAPRLDADGRALQATALFYSSDQGQTSSVIYSPEPFAAPTAYLREMTGHPTADFSRRDMNRERFVVQVSDTQAYAWASEFMWYSVGETQHRTMLTTRAALERSAPGAEWRITTVTRHPEQRVTHLSTSLDGRTYAVLQDKDGEWLAKLDPQTGEWIERQKSPSLLPSWLATDHTSARYFWNNGDYQVVSMWGNTVVSRLLIPFLDEQAEIDTDAHFYTRDGGRTWHQLAIPGYLGVMGLAPQASLLYWSKGNWYKNDEPLQWQYDLAQ